MRISTLRFLVYISVMTLLVPTGSGKVAIAWAFLYYLVMTWLTVVFTRMDGIRLKFWIPDLRSGLVRGLKAFPLFLLVVFIVNFLFPVSVESGVDPQPNFPFFLLALFMAPIAEEVMFRGYVQEYFRQRLKPELAVLISALFFSLFHPFSVFPYVFVVGVFLSTLREYTNSILPGMVVHGLNNFLSVLTIFLWH